MNRRELWKYVPAAVIGFLAISTLLPLIGNLTIAAVALLVLLALHRQ